MISQSIQSTQTMIEIKNNNGSATGYVNWILRLEGLIVLICTLLTFKHFSLASWKTFFLFFFFPDISFLGYVVGKKFGSIFYNVMHSYTAPLVIGALMWAGYFVDFSYLIIIWIGHIGFDRALGYGLKYSTGFEYTHLGIIKSWKNKK
jgi:hypothetical protein